MDGFIPKVVCGKGSGQETKVVSGKDVSGVEGEYCVRFVVAGAWRSGCARCNKKKGGIGVGVSRGGFERCREWVGWVEVVESG